MRNKSFTLVTVLVSGVCAVAAADETTKKKDTGKMKETPPVAVHMSDASGRDIGTAMLVPSPQGLSFKFDLKGLPPGAHAVTIHQIAKCDGPDYKSAGAKATDKAMTINADQKGNAKQTVMEPSASIEHDKPNSLTDSDGAAIVIHAAAQDPDSMPIACGVVLGAEVK